MTRGITVEQLSKTWFSGPDFLWKHKSQWIKDREIPSIPIRDPELKKTITCQVTSNVDHPLDLIIKYYSDWSRMIKAVAWLIRCRNVLLKRNTSSVLMAKNLQQAEHNYDYSSCTIPGIS